MIELKSFERIDWLPESKFGVVQNKNLFCYGTDALLLSKFCTSPANRIHHKDVVVDLCTGNGVVPVLLCEKTRASFIAVEIQKASYELAQKTVKLNGLDNRIKLINGDIRNIKNLIEKKSATVVTANPPYMKTTSCGIAENKMTALNIARHEVMCNLRDVIFAADYLLKSSGTFFMIHRPQRLNEIFTILDEFNFEPKRIKFVHPCNAENATMVLIEARKDARHGLIVEPPEIISDS